MHSAYNRMEVKVAFGKSLPALPQGLPCHRQTFSTCWDLTLDHLWHKALLTQVSLYYQFVAYVATTYLLLSMTVNSTPFSGQQQRCSRVTTTKWPWRPSWQIHAVQTMTVEPPGWSVEWHRTEMMQRMTIEQDQNRQQEDTCESQEPTSPSTLQRIKLNSSPIYLFFYFTITSEKSTNNLKHDMVWTLCKIP